MNENTKTTSSNFKFVQQFVNNSYYDGVNFDENPGTDQKIANLQILFQNDINACDMKWSLFVGAAQNFRFDSLLRPFPQKYMLNDRTCDSDKLMSVINKTPAFKIIWNKMFDVTFREQNEDVIDLLHWVLVFIKDPFLMSVKNSDFSIILNQVQSVIPAIMPSNIFRVGCLESSQAELRFQSLAQDLTTNFAFHGSKFECFYSIMNFGLQQHLSKVAAFGEGTYLSSESSVSIHYCPAGVGWIKSQIGDKPSCLAICEYVEHPNFMRSGVKDTSTTSKAFGNSVPEKYFLIRNNDIIRVRYLLIYSKPCETVQLDNSHNYVINWIWRNKAVLSICCYAFFLACIGVANSKGGLYYRQLFLRKTKQILEHIYNKYF